MAKGLAISVAALILVVSGGGVAIAQTPRDLTDVMGARGRSLEDAMHTHGYVFAEARGAQFWWNGDRGRCVAVSISNGRVSRIRAVEARECGRADSRRHGYADDRPNWERGHGASHAVDCNAPDLSEADRYRCPSGGFHGAAGGREAAVKACRDAFAGDARLGTVSALRPGFWEVILSDNYGRKVSCTGRAEGRVEEWTELGRH